jgi:hypothetical protein
MNYILNMDVLININNQLIILFSKNPFIFVFLGLISILFLFILFLYIRDCITRRPYTYPESYPFQNTINAIKHEQR